MLLMMVLFLFLASRKRGLGRGAGFALLSVYICYLALMLTFFCIRGPAGGK